MRPRVPRRGRAAGPEGVIAAILFWGGLLAAIFLLIGLALAAARGGFGRQALDLWRVNRSGAAPTDTLTSVGDVLRALASRPAEPLTVMTFGLVLLLIAPVLGVAAAIAAFLREGDRRYAAIGGIVLAMLFASLVLAVS